MTHPDIVLKRTDKVTEVAEFRMQILWIYIINFI